MEEINTFFDGAFHVGDADADYLVEDPYYASEYSMMTHLAVATAGDEVAVGTLCISEPMSHEEYRRHNNGVPLSRNCEVYTDWFIDVVIVPGVGVWVCQPVFDSAHVAWEHVPPRLEVLERALERPLTELPIQPALVATLFDAEVDLRGVDPLYFYDVETYRDVTESLTKRMPGTWLPNTVDAVIEELLRVGHWIDAKNPDDLIRWPIPAWLADMVDVRRAA